MSGWLKSRIAPGRGARAVEGTVTPRSEMRNREQDCFILLVYRMLGLEHQMRRSGANFLEFFSALIQLNVMRSDHGTALASHDRTSANREEGSVPLHGACIGYLSSMP